MRNKESLGSKLFDIFNVFAMALVIIICLYPLLYTFAISSSEANAVRANMVSLMPVGFNLRGYESVFKNTVYWTGYKNSIIYTALNTFFSLAITCTFAYPLTRRELIGRKAITLLMVITMFFSGGMIPNFVLIKSLGMYNTLWSVVIPGALNASNVVIVRTFMSGIPEEIAESVRVEGGNDLQIFFKIILPLSKPVIATIALFVAVGSWNTYFTPMIYLKDRAKYPISVVLKEMMIQQSNEALGISTVITGENVPSTESILSAAIIVSILPILFSYPYIQKYFVKGAMVGSLKG